MAEITDVVEVPISDLLTDLSAVRYNPVAAQRAMMSRISQITKGVATFVDPSNPFILLLEASCVNTAGAILENKALLRAQYASLATTEEELYRHMSDKHYKSRFATPAPTYIKMLINLTELTGNMLDSSSEGCKKATIPRDSQIEVNGYMFTIQYPIDFRIYYNGVLQITYDTTYASPLKTLKTNVIDYTKRKDASNVEWLMIDLPVDQFTLTSTNLTLQASSYFTEDIEFTDSFYFIRVMRKVNNLWVDMKITHTDQVYDPYTPTAVVKVYSAKVNVSIPPVYVSSGQVSGEIRVDVYTTKGAISVNMANYQSSAFNGKLRAIDEARDINAYTNVFGDVSFFFYSDEFVVGGSDPVSFSTLRQMVIDDSLGEQEIPITPVELVSDVERLGFGLVKNVDTITNRIYLATRSLPAPTDSALITAANITIDTLITTYSDLTKFEELYHNHDRLTITPKTLYKYDNGQLSIFPQSEVRALLAKPKSSLIETINANNFVYSPFHYVLDNTSSEFETRAYYLDNPKADNLSFVSQNTTATLQVNTNTFEISKIEEGYKLLVNVKSDDYYKALKDSQINAVLAFKPNGESNYAYLVGTPIALNDSERIFQFIIETNYDIDSDHNLCLSNFCIYSDSPTDLFTTLETDFMLLYTTSSVPEEFVADVANTLVPRFLIGSDSIAITRESITIKFGDALESLWSKTRTMAGTLGYQTYTLDVPAVYEKDIYDIDSETGSCFEIVDGEIKYNIAHKAGDPVLDADGFQVYKHRAGDVIIGDDGLPKKKSSVFATRCIDIMFIDGTYYFATDDAYLDYRAEVAKTISTWVTETLKELDDSLLEQTEIYYYPKKSIGSVLVKLSSDFTTSIESTQSFSIKLYVPSSIYQDDRMRKSLQSKTITIINSYVQQTVVSQTDIVGALRTAYGSAVTAFELSGLGGTKNYPTVTLADNSNRLSLAKVLKEEDDGTLIVTEDVSFEFIEYTQAATITA